MSKYLYKGKSLHDCTYIEICECVNILTNAIKSNDPRIYFNAKRNFYEGFLKSANRIKYFREMTKRLN